MTAPPSDTFTLRLFGTFAATRGGIPLTGLHLRDGERLLAFLALRDSEPVAARELAERFYPAEARGNLVGQNDFPSLRQALFCLRKALGSDADRLTRPTKTTVHLDLSGADVDVLAFDRCTRAERGQGEEEEKRRRGDIPKSKIQNPNDPMTQQPNDPIGAWETAVALYHAPVLEGWNEAWAVDARKRRRRTFERLLRHLAQEAQGSGNEVKAEQWLRRLLISLPDDEAAARDLMRLLNTRRQYVESYEIQEALTEKLKSTGRSTEPETLALFAALRTEREQNRILIVPAQKIPTAQQDTETSGSVLSPVPCSLSPILPLSALEPAGGAVPVGSPFYVERPADAEFAQAVARRDSIVLIKGARQVGKTSLLAHGLQGARQSGVRVVISDFQNFNEAQFASPDSLLLALATTLAVQLDLETLPREVWDADSGANMNLGLYLRRHALRAVSGALVWALDEVDRLFGCPFGSEVFGLFRSWHNARALDPESPWSRLTLAIAYSTEASLFITDLNQSPFNVGTRLSLHDFTLEQTASLNSRYGSPLSEKELSRFHDLVGGQPYLVRRGLDELVTRRINIAQLEAESGRDDGLYGEHLRRMSMVLARSPEMTDVVRALLNGKPCESPDAFFRLRTAGVLSGSSCQEARLRCRLYADYLALHL